MAKLYKKISMDNIRKVFDPVKQDYIYESPRGPKNIICNNLEGTGYKNVDSRKVQVYQIFSSTDHTCSKNGLNKGTGNSPCHDMYLTEDDFEKLVYAPSFDRIKQDFDEITDKYLTKNEVVQLVAAETASNQIVGATYLNPKTEKSFTVGNAFSSLSSDMRIEFNAPLSGNVLLDFSFFRDTIDASGTLFISLGKENTTSLGAGFEKIIHKADRFDDIQLTHSYILEGLTPGNSYTYYVLFKSDRNDMKIKYGGTYPAFIAKASVLPGTLLT